MAQARPWNQLRSPTWSRASASWASHQRTPWPGPRPAGPNTWRASTAIVEGGVPGVGRHPVEQGGQHRRGEEAHVEHPGGLDTGDVAEGGRDDPQGAGRVAVAHPVDGLGVDGRPDGGAGDLPEGGQPVVGGHEDQGDVARVPGRGDGGEHGSAPGDAGPRRATTRLHGTHGPDTTEGVRHRPTTGPSGRSVGVPPAGRVSGRGGRRARPAHSGSTWRPTAEGSDASMWPPKPCTISSTAWSSQNPARASCTPPSANERRTWSRASSGRPTPTPLVSSVVA